MKKNEEEVFLEIVRLVSRLSHETSGIGSGYDNKILEITVESSAYSHIKYMCFENRNSPYISFDPVGEDIRMFGVKITRGN